MKHVYQTIVDKGHGNCMQAAVASLFNFELDQVPNFISYGNKWYEEFEKFFSKMLDKEDLFLVHINTKDLSLKELKKALEYDCGINGYFYAVVKSQTHEDTTHAVIIDKNMKIVHDPNPNQKALHLKEKDIISYLAIKDNYNFDVNGKFNIDTYY